MQRSSIQLPFDSPKAGLFFSLFFVFSENQQPAPKSTYSMSHDLVGSRGGSATEIGGPWSNWKRILSLHAIIPTGPTDNCYGFLFALWSVIDDVGKLLCRGDDSRYHLMPKCSYCCRLRDCPFFFRNKIHSGRINNGTLTLCLLFVCFSENKWSEQKKIGKNAETRNACRM